MSESEAPVCNCCTFGDHCGMCTCPDSRTKACCHPQNHFRGTSVNRDHMMELAAASEGANILEVTTHRFSVLAQRPDFPKPVARLRCGAIYLAQELRDFHARRVRIAGRPKKAK